MHKRTTIEARVIMCKCNKSRQVFGVRVEKKNNDWFRTWAFPISEKVAKNEGYIDEKIQGSFMATSEYRGCPYCKTYDFALCGNCGKMGCWSGESIYTCQWCGNSSNVSVAESFNVNGSSF